MLRPNVSHCIQENELHYNPKPHDYSKDYLTFVALEDGTFVFYSEVSNAVSYSLDGGETWNELTTDTDSPTVTAGNKIMWKRTLSSYGDGGNIATFGSEGRFNIQGNTMSLIYGDNFVGETNLHNLSFQQAFAYSNVVDAENLILPATALTNSCYSSMFEGCASLITVPVLPATTLTESCYRAMFAHCTSLTTAPTLPAEALADGCYTSMFYGCTSLTTAPVLPSTTLAGYCYRYMFNGCTSLATAPALPATTLTEECYSGMFAGCEGLATAPALPATTLAESCYDSMFDSCTSLIAAPVLPATTLVSGCYSYMFIGCTSLNYIKCLATTVAGEYTMEECTSGWVSDVAENGTFVKAASMNDWEVGENGIPEGWTVETATA